MLLNTFVSRSVRQTTSGDAMVRTHSGAIETPRPAPMSRRIVSQ